MMLLQTFACRFTPDELVNLVWAISELEFHQARTIEVLARHFMSLPPSRLTGTQLAVAARAFAKCGHTGARLFRAIARAATPHVFHMQTGDLTSLAWALATARRPSNMIMEHATEAAISNLKTMTAKQISELSSALMVAGALDSHRRLLSTVSSQSARPMHSGTVILGANASQPPWAQDDGSEAILQVENRT
eukprot:365228-Chlamydomonas_euryale.AAC.23